MDKEVILKSLDEIKELVNDDKKFKYKNIVNFNCKRIEEELESVEKKLRALEIIKKHFIIRMSEEAELNGNVWGRLVRIQSKEDEGTWDTTAIANIVDYKEDFDVLKEVLE